MAKPNRGELWMADLGFVAKVRSVLILSVDFLRKPCLLPLGASTGLAGAQHGEAHFFPRA